MKNYKKPEFMIENIEIEDCILTSTGGSLSVIDYDTDVRDVIDW